ncbi:hypothetical protein [Pseudogemmobacter sonorensis]|uniref:hypothetical protein n=1 Tax=Pseudogemmobacter sonorensis TaxID=2989681 RepID=UPI00368A9E98
MADPRSPLAPLLHQVEQALDLLDGFRSPALAALPAEPLPSLAEQCSRLAARPEAGPPPLRMIHHMACTGGTLISKALAVLPNVVLLSEIDPLSTLRGNPGSKAPFAPSDLILAMRHAPRPVPEDVLVATFRAGTLAAHGVLAEKGMRMVIRDHSHSHFCTGVDPAARASLREMLAGELPLLSAVTVRHPLESFLSLGNNRWTHFSPFTLEEYSQRYSAFLDRHAGLDILRYEEFVLAPEATLRRLCDILALPFHPAALDLLSAARLTGDSGRSSPVVGPRPQKAVPEEMLPDCRGAAYVGLCGRLGYDPLPDGAAA